VDGLIKLMKEFPRLSGFLLSNGFYYLGGSMFWKSSSSILFEI